MVERAREAVAKGSASQAKIPTAIHGVQVDSDGQVVCAHDPTPTVSGNGVLHLTGKRKLSGREDEFTKTSNGHRLCTIKTTKSMLRLKLCTGRGMDICKLGQSRLLIEF